MKSIRMLFMSGILAASFAGADVIAPSHNCAKPLRPSHFATAADERNYRRQLDTYKRCLSDFVVEQNKRARMHSEAARIAENELRSIGI